jgi:hypothetical protein
LLVFLALVAVLLLVLLGRLPGNAPEAFMKAGKILKAGFITGLFDV